ncbi:hypothetical protein Tco_0514754 [Tanacetum coccineum]
MARWWAWEGRWEMGVWRKGEGRFNREGWEWRQLGWREGCREGGEPERDVEKSDASGEAEEGNDVRRDGGRGRKGREISRVEFRGMVWREVSVEKMRRGRGTRCGEGRGVGK